MDHASLILGSIAVLELLVIIVGSVWSIGRDLWIRNQSQILADRLGDCTDAIERVSMFNDRIIEKLKSSDDLGKDNRRELLELLREHQRENARLMLDIEKRTRECIREFQQHFGTSINFNHDATGTQIGNQNRQQG